MPQTTSAVGYIIETDKGYRSRTNGFTGLLICAHIYRYRKVANRIALDINGTVRKIVITIEG